jgi:hypothetical protein
MRENEQVYSRPYCVKMSPRFMASLGDILLLVVPDSDEVAGWGEGVPGNVEPVGGGEELVGIFTIAEKRDEALELGGVLGADVGSLPQEVLGVLDAADQAVHAAVAEAGVDDDGTDLLSGRLQEHQTAIGQVGHDLQRRNVGRVLLPVAELCQRKVRG